MKTDDRPPQPTPDQTLLPRGVARPSDDGAARHLGGQHMPPIALPSTNGDAIRVDTVPGGFQRRVLYAYPRTGRPGEEPLTPDWDSIPGARGCTESCGFRDHAQELAVLGACVAGISTQGSDYQREAAGRLGLTFPLLSDAELKLTRALGLPTFDIAGHRLLKRLTLVSSSAGVIEHVFYPVFPPDTHAEEVLAWLRAQS